MEKLYNTYFTKKVPNIVANIFKYGIMLFVVVISLTPLIWIFISSFKNNMEVLDNAFSIPSKISFASYTDAIKLSKIHLYFVNSILVSVTATAIPLIIYGMSAYALARFNFKGKSIIYTLLISSLLIPGNAMIQSIYSLTADLGLYDTKTILILVYSGFGMPITIFILRSYFADLPKELEEAAYIEGCGFFGTFLKIIFPLAKPAMASAGVLLFISNWNEFLYALLLTSSQKNRTIPLALRAFLSFFTYDYPAMFAAIIMAVLPSIVFYVLLQEQIMESLVAGAIKG